MLSLFANEKPPIPCPSLARFPFNAMTVPNFLNPEPRPRKIRGENSLRPQPYIKKLSEPNLAGQHCSNLSLKAGVRVEPSRFLSPVLPWKTRLYDPFRRSVPQRCLRGRCGPVR